MDRLLKFRKILQRSPQNGKREIAFYCNLQSLNNLIKFLRNSRLEVFCKKVVLKNFAKFAGKHLWQGLFFNKVAGLRPETLFKKRLGTGVFL